MKFIILTKYKMDAVERNCSTFIAEDLLEIIESHGSFVIVAGDDSEELKSTFKKMHPEAKYIYEISIEKKELA